MREAEACDIAGKTDTSTDPHFSRTNVAIFQVIQVISKPMQSMALLTMV